MERKRFRLPRIIRAITEGAEINRQAEIEKLSAELERPYTDEDRINFKSREATRLRQAYLSRTFSSSAQESFVPSIDRVILFREDLKELNNLTDSELDSRIKGNIMEELKILKRNIRS